MMAAELVEREIPGRGEKKRFGRVQFAVGAGPQNPHIGLLHDVVDIELPTETAGEPRAQHRLVRLHVGGEPLAKFGIGRGHGQENRRIYIRR